MDKSADEDGDGAADVDGAEFGSDGSNGEDSDDDSGDTDDGSSDDDGDGQSTVNFSICVCPLLAMGEGGGDTSPPLSSGGDCMYKLAHQAPPPPSLPP